MKMWIYCFLALLILITVAICHLTVPQNGSYASCVIMLGKDMTLIVISMASMLQIIYPTQEKTSNLSLVYLTLCTISTWVVVIVVEKDRTNSFAASKTLKTTEIVQPLVQTFYTLIILTERTEVITDTWGSALHETLRDLSTVPDNASVLSESSRLTLTHLLTKRSKVHNTALKTSDFKQTLYRLILDLGLTFKRRHPDNPYLRLLLAYVMCLRLGLKWRGIFELESVLKQRTDPVVTVAALMFLRTIETEVVEEDIVSTQNNGMDTAALLMHQRDFESFRDLLGRLAETMRRFWEELTHTKSSGNLLQEVGFQIAALTDEVSSTLQSITTKSSKLNVQLLQLYSEFLFLVLSEHEEARRIHLKAQNILTSMTASRNYGKGLLMMKNFDTFSPG